MTAGAARRHKGVSAAVLSLFLLATGCSSSTVRPGQAPLVKLDGAVYGRPLVVGGTVFAATENDTVYAISANDSSVQWRTHVATAIPKSDLPCGDINPEGITGSPAYDPSAHRVYVVAETTGTHHILFGLDATTGGVATQVPLDPPFGDRAATLQRPALLVQDGRVYAAFGGNFGDCGHYFGAVASVDVAAGNAVSWYQASSSAGGGIWAPGPPPVANGLLYFSVGNGAADDASKPYDGSDSIVALTPDLKRADFFAPATWARDNADDADLGSMNPALVGTHAVIAGKAGDGYVVDAAHLGGIGAAQPAFHGCKAFGPAAVGGDTAYLPCTDGTMAVRIAADGTAKVLWHAAVHANGPPVLAAGKVWAVDWDSGTLYALDPATGAVVSSIAAGPVPHFATPAVAGARLFLGTSQGVEVFSTG